MDDLGHDVVLSRPVRRVVSLVPSLTETLADAAPGLLVGATDWCTHPADLAVARVRGTKNPDLDAIRALAPDLVVANQEENRELDVQRLRAAGVPVWVTRIESVAEAFSTIGRLLDDVLGVAEPGWLPIARTAWARSAAPPDGPTGRVVVPIWRDPWMVVGPATFTGDLLARLGLRVIAGDDVPSSGSPRYPHVAVEDLRAAGPDLVLLPDEPYAFTADDGPEAFPQAPVALVSGRALTWYGPSLATAREEVLGAVRRAVEPADQPSGRPAGARPAGARPAVVEWAPGTDRR